MGGLGVGGCGLRRWWRGGGVWGGKNILRLCTTYVLKAFMPLATMPKAVVSTALLFLYRLRVASSGETETQCNKE